MKKQYRKPQIAFDSYVVATNIANCTWGGGYGGYDGNPNTNDPWRPIDIGGFTIYTEDQPGCDFVETECFGVPLLDQNLFRS